MFKGRSGSNRRGRILWKFRRITWSECINAMFQADIPVEVKGSDEYGLSSLVSFVSTSSSRFIRVATTQERLQDIINHASIMSITGAVLKEEGTLFQYARGSNQYLFHNERFPKIIGKQTSHSLYYVSASTICRCEDKHLPDMEQWTQNGMKIWTSYINLQDCAQWRETLRWVMY